MRCVPLSYNNITCVTSALISAIFHQSANTDKRPGSSKSAAVDLIADAYVHWINHDAGDGINCLQRLTTAILTQSLIRDCLYNTLHCYHGIRVVFEKFDYKPSNNLINVNIFMILIFLILLF